LKKLIAFKGHGFSHAMPDLYCHPERSLLHISQQTESKDLRLFFDKLRIHNTGRDAELFGYIQEDSNQAR
jgi:hypothetical protein